MLKYILLITALVIILYGFLMQPIKNQEITGIFVLKNGWHGEQVLKSEIKGTYDIWLKFDYGKKTENSKKNLKSKIRFQAVDSTNSKKSEQIIYLKTTFLDEEQINTIDGNAPFFIRAERDHTYKITFDVESCTFYTNDIHATYHMDIDGLDMEKANIYRWSLIATGVLLLTISTLLMIVSRNRKSRI